MKSISIPILLLLIYITALKVKGEEPVSKGYIREGCGAMKVTTSNGIYLIASQNSSNEVNKIVISSEDSMTIHVTAIGGCIARIYEIKINNSPCNYVSTFHTFSESAHVIAKSGVYEVTGSANWIPYSVQFTLTLDPVGLRKIDLQPVITIFPNPAQQKITVACDEELLQKIEILNLTGQTISIFKIENKQFELPIQNLPCGIYYIQVATLNGRTFLKKFSVIDN